MRNWERQMLEALRAFLFHAPAPLLLTEEADWQRLWVLCQEQKVLPMVVDVLAPALTRAGSAPASLPGVRTQVLRSTAVQLQKNQAFLTLYQDLLQAGLRPLVVKGAVCRSLYPKPDLRPSADEDLLILPEELPEVLELLRARGFESAREDGEQVIPCRDGTTGLYLELHRSLFPPASQAYGGLNRFFDGAFDHIFPMNMDSRMVLTLNPPDHFLYLVLHSFKHFLHSGFGIRQVCDICLFAQTYGQEIPWDRVSDALGQARADLFAANLLEIGRRHLGFTRYPERVQAWLDGWQDGLDCGDLLADLLSGGIYGGSTQTRLHSSRITLNAVSQADRAGGDHRLLRTLFPPREDLTGTYPYLKRHRWLLPAAWGQRIWTYLREGGGSAARESVAIGEQRVALLKKYRVIP